MENNGHKWKSDSFLLFFEHTVYDQSRWILHEVKEQFKWLLKLFELLTVAKTLKIWAYFKILMLLMVRFTNILQETKMYRITVYAQLTSLKAVLHWSNYGNLIACYKQLYRYFWYFKSHATNRFHCSI